MARDDDDDVTEAHDQRMTVHILTTVQVHEPQPGDPHYDLFAKARTRLKRQRLWVCAINDDYCGGDIELHHTHIESMSLDDMDLAKVNQAFGLHLDNDDEFAAWIESPGNLEALCVVHHRTHYGVHSLPHPLWEPLRYRKHNAKASAEIESVEGGDVEVDTTTATATTTKRTPRSSEATSDTRSHTTVKEAGHTVDDKVTTTHSETRRSAPRTRKTHKGVFARLFGR